MEEYCGVGVTLEVSLHQLMHLWSVLHGVWRNVRVRGDVEVRRCRGDVGVYVLAVGG